jgi:hypothetical protein
LFPAGIRDKSFFPAGIRYRSLASAFRASQS